MKKYQTVCFLSARNLGDAVIHASALRQIQSNGFLDDIVVWTKPKYQAIFEANIECRFEISPFPMGTAQEFGVRDFAKFLLSVYRLREIRFDLAFDLIGDFREKICLDLLSAKSVRQISWNREHPFVQGIRLWPSILSHTHQSTCLSENLYDAYDEFLRLLFGIHHAYGQKIKLRATGNLIGIHPFASQDCKHWQDEKWVALAEQIIQAGFNLVVFGAPGDESKIASIFGSLKGEVTVFCEAFSALRRRVSDLNIMIGLDSFGVHLANSVGVRSIVINVCNHPKLWLPPLGVNVANGAGCRFYPCFNKPKCLNTEFQYRCSRDVSVDMVWHKVNEMLRCRRV